MPGPMIVQLLTICQNTRGSISGNQMPDDVPAEPHVRHKAFGFSLDERFLAAGFIIWSRWYCAYSMSSLVKRG